jgi:hypothetical protein
MFIPNKRSKLETKLPKVRHMSKPRFFYLGLPNSVSKRNRALLTVWGLHMSNIRTRLGKSRLDSLSVLYYANAVELKQGMTCIVAMSKVQAEGWWKYLTQ